MKSTLTIFRLSLRSILRERVAVSMLGLLLLVLLLLPAGLRSDGTLEGAVRMQIRYSLGFSFVLLAGMTLWVSCAAVAGDLTSKRLQMVLTKPVSRASVWWGKWMAVVTLITGLGVLCGGVTLFRVNRLVEEADLNAEQQKQFFTQVLTARRPVDLPVEDFSREAESFYEEQLAAGALPNNAPREELLPQLERYLKVERSAADAGETVSWTFPLHRPLREGEEIQLFYQYDGSAMGTSTIEGEWRISDLEKLDVLTAPVRESPHGDQVIPFTVPAGMDGMESLQVSFHHLQDEGSKIFFQPDRGVRLFRRGGAFAPNLFRAVLVLSGLLAILAAIGVSTGSIFSLPVACYSASVVLLLQGFSGVVSEVVENGLPADLAESPWMLQQLLQFRIGFFSLVLRILQPLQVENPLTRVADGVLVSWGEVFRILIFRFSPVILLAAVAGIVLFSRREVGDAT